MKIHFISDIALTTSQFCPPLGIGYLAAYLRRARPDLKVSLSYRSPSILAEIAEEKPDVVAISSTSRWFPLLRTVSKAIVKEFKIPVVWGGVHISLVPQDLPPGHVGVIGEGEATLLALLDHYHKSGSLTGHSLGSTAFHDGEGNLVLHPPSPPIDHLDSIPPPDLDLLRVEWSPQTRAAVMTSRGCPYSCSFCASAVFWRHRVRFHSAARVVAEFSNLADVHGVNEILIYDDLFIADRRRLKEIEGLVTERGLHRRVRFECLGRADLVDQEVVAHLKNMNVYRLSMGLESGSPRLLAYHKGSGLTHDIIARATRLLKEAGIEVVVSVMLASPGETSREIESTYQILRRLGVDDFGLAICSPFPGTKLWSDSVASGKITDRWSHRYFVLDPWAYRSSHEGKVTLGAVAPKRLLRHIDRFEDLSHEMEMKRALRSSGLPHGDIEATLRFFRVRRRISREKSRILDRIRRTLATGLARRIKLKLMASPPSRSLLARKAGKLLAAPPVINIETTNQCKASCLMCPHKDMKRPKGRMAMELFGKILGDLENVPVRTLSLNLIGEPFQDPDFLERIVAIRKNSKLRVDKLSFVTNAHSMTGDAISTLLKLNVNEVIVSLNGGDEESYRKVMGISFPRTLTNVSSLFLERERRAKNRPAIRINCVELEQNSESLWFIRELFQDAADEVTIHRPLNWAGYLGAAAHRVDLPCRVLWTDINILWDGRMVPCCRDWDGTLEVGDVSSQSVWEAWKGRKLDVLRGIHLAGRPRQVPLCAECDAMEMESGFWFRHRRD